MKDSALRSSLQRLIIHEIPLDLSALLMGGERTFLRCIVLEWKFWEGLKKDVGITKMCERIMKDVNDGTQQR